MRLFINLLTFAEFNRRGLEEDSRHERKIVLLTVDNATRKLNFISCQCISGKILIIFTMGINRTLTNVEHTLLVNNIMPGPQGTTATDCNYAPY